MEHFLDKAAKDLAKGVSRRKVLGGIVYGLLLSPLAFIGVPKRMSAASCLTDCERRCTTPDGRLQFLCFRNCVNSDQNNCGACNVKCPAGQACVNGRCTGPDCNNCQACDLDAGQCGLACPDSCSALTLRSIAAATGDYTRIVQYLNGLGFTHDYDQAAVLLSGGTSIRSVLSSHFSSSTDGWEATLNFVDDAGQTAVNALVRQNLSIQYGLFVTSAGVVSPVARPSNISLGAAALNSENGIPVAANAITPKSSQECDASCTAVCSLVGVLSHSTIDALMCGATGSSGLLCAFSTDSYFADSATSSDCKTMCLTSCACNPGATGCGVNCLCAAGQTCDNGQCRSLPTCAGVSLTDEAISRAVETAITGISSPWWYLDVVLARTAAELGCQTTDLTSLSASTRSASPQIDLPAFCDNNYCAEVAYCGHGNSGSNPGDFHPKEVTDCLNMACFTHDTCYSQACVADDCIWSSQSDFCDQDFFLAAANCISSLNSNWDRIVNVIAEKLKTKTAPSSCSNPPCSDGCSRCNPSTGKCVGCSDGETCCAGTCAAPENCCATRAGTSALREHLAVAALQQCGTQCCEGPCAPDGGCCPQARICGEQCCPAGASCCNGNCCPPGETCVNGVCQETCSYKCPCPSGSNAGKAFATCLECLEVCPSGLACFGYSYCEPIGSNCPTCP